MRAITRPPGSRRGISTVVGATLAILILVTFLGGVYLWTYSKERRMSQLDEARSAEDIALRAAFTYEEGAYPVNVTAENTGSVDVQVIRLWLIDGTTNQHSHVDLVPPLNVRVGETKVIPTSALGIDIGEGETVSYTFKAATKRGRSFSTQLELAEAEYTDYPIVVLNGTCDATTPVAGDNETVTGSGTISNVTGTISGDVNGTISKGTIKGDVIGEMNGKDFSGTLSGTISNANITSGTLSNGTISDLSGNITVTTTYDETEVTVWTLKLEDGTVNTTTTYTTSKITWTLTLTVWNENDKAITIDKLIVINLENSTYHVMEGDVIEGLPWKIQPRQIATKTFTGTHTWRKAEPERRIFAGDVRVELLDEKSTLVGSYTLKIPVTLA